LEHHCSAQDGVGHDHERDVAGPAALEHAEADHDHAGHSHPGHSHSGPSHAAPSHAENSHAGHGRPAHSHAGHSHFGHGHAGHGHAHGPAQFDRAFAIGVSLNLALVAAQIGFGLAAGSLALIADAGHNFSDVVGLLIAWGATALGRRPPTARRTYGYGRSSILASLINAVILLVGVGAIALAAIQRLLAPAAVDEAMVVWVALAGIAINGATAWMFLHGRRDDVNIRGAFLHMAADAGVSAGVVVAALLVGVTGWQWLDPLMGLVIAVVITAGTWDLLRQSVDLAMDVVPEGIDRAAVEAYLAALPGVAEVHDLHIWPLSTTSNALTAHLVRPDGGVHDGLLADAAEALRQRFRIDHATIQVESGSAACALAPADVV
jgi:cobalt-zinc-cadmium efflux system protein